MFIDQAKIHVSAGDGGDGCLAFRREKYVPKGGPSGGNGGKGGDVYIRGVTHLNTLLPFQYRRHFAAGRGGHGSGNNRSGPKGKDLVIEVPVGTQIYGEDQKLLFDLREEGQTGLVAKGGRGGRGNASFATSTDQAPKRFEVGDAGQAATLVLELKILADVGIIGYPNAGKSTLISVLSSAKPKIADYPFTTLSPNLGVVQYDDYSSFVAADIPGLIEGAHQGIGLGHQFLRHIERTLVLVHLVDVSEEAETDPVRAVETIWKELERYDPAIRNKPEIIVASKADVAHPQRLQRLESYCQKKQLNFQSISAVTGAGISELKRAIVKHLGTGAD